jgi:hypothetical protein
MSWALQYGADAKRPVGNTGNLAHAAVPETSARPVEPEPGTGTGTDTDPDQRLRRLLDDIAAAWSHVDDCASDQRSRAIGCPLQDVPDGNASRASLVDSA